MAIAERTRGAVSLQAAVGAFGRRLAAFTGALVALASLIADTPLSVASLRGALATLALIGLTRVAEWLSERTVSPAPASPASEGGGASPEIRR